MPPTTKIQKKDIILASLEILKKEDISKLNARKIANYLNCSVQPIFYNFKNMEDLKRQLFDQIYQIYHKYMIKGSKEEKPYKGMGLAYIKFARDYPNYFKIIFMNQTNLTPEYFIASDDISTYVFEKGMEFTGFQLEEQKKFHLKVWIFTHGLATLVATNTVKFNNDQIEELLKEAICEMVIGIKKRGNI